MEAFPRYEDRMHGLDPGGRPPTTPGYSQNLTSEHMRDFADIAGIEFALIGQHTDLHQFRNELRWNEAYYR